jgi:SAM-dependent methyltransferase
MTRKSDFVIGLDTSRAFIHAARDLMLHRHMKITLKEEGYLTRAVELALPDGWDCRKVEFIVADALSLPLRANTGSSLTSLNLMDKVYSPMQHLTEADRVTRPENGQFLLSDPFSWSEDAAPESNWLGGQRKGPYTSRGQEHILKILAGEGNLLKRGWTIESHGHVWWKIRTHANHYEQIRSCYIKAVR